MNLEEQPKKIEDSIENKDNAPEIKNEGSEDARTFEDLNELGENKINSGSIALDRLKTDGRDGIDKGNQSVGLSPEKFQEMKNAKGVKSDVEEIQKSASEAFNELANKIRDMIASGVDHGKIREELGNLKNIVNKKTEQGETDREAHDKLMQEKKEAHEREMKEIREEHEEELRKIKEIDAGLESDSNEIKESTERAVFGGKTKKESEQYIEESKKEMEAKVAKLINAEQEKSVERKRIDEKWENELKKKDEEMKEKEEEFFQAMDDIKNKAIKEAKSRNRQFQEGEKTQVKVCPKCGKESEIRGANFCMYCGGDLEKTENEEKK